MQVQAIGWSAVALATGIVQADDRKASEQKSRRFFERRSCRHSTASVGDATTTGLLQSANANKNERQSSAGSTRNPL
jgi:hypothetical protein